MLAAVVWGCRKIKTERMRTAELDALCRLVGYIGDNIAHFGTPLPEIYAGYSDGLLDGCGFSGILRQNGMTAALDARLLSQNDSVTAILYRFSRALGGGDRAEQTELCEYTKKQLTDILDSRKRESRDKEKLWRTCPVLIALAAILLVIQ